MMCGQLWLRGGATTETALSRLPAEGPVPRPAGQWKEGRLRREHLLPVSERQDRRGLVSDRQGGDRGSALTAACFAVSARPPGRPEGIPVFRNPCYRANMKEMDTHMNARPDALVHDPRKTDEARSRALM